MKESIAALAAGVLFGFGLAVAQMTDPLKVLGFLDLAGDWDASLALVFGAALGTALVLFRFILRRPRPRLADSFHLPAVGRNVIDRPLLLGAALFGLGWGISGYCPGPAVALLAVPGNRETWLVLPAIVAGIVLSRITHRARAGVRRETPAGPYSANE